jgi:hypothetical protein
LNEKFSFSAETSKKSFVIVDEMIGQGHVEMRCEVEEAMVREKSDVSLKSQSRINRGSLSLTD